MLNNEHQALQVALMLNKKYNNSIIFFIFGRMRSNNMKNLKISKKLMLSYSVVLILLVISILVSIFNLISIGKQVTTFYNGPFQVSAAANIIDTRFEQMQKSVYRSICNEDDKITKDAIDDASTAAEVIQTQMSIVEEHFLGDMEIVQNLKAKLEELAPMRAAVLELSDNNKNKEAAQYMEDNNIIVIKEAQVYLDELIKDATNTGEKLVGSLKSAQFNSIITLTILGIASLAISIAFAVTITRGITKPVSEIEKTAKNLEIGNLNAEITYESKDEMGSLANSMKKSMMNLSHMIEDISYLLDEISTGNFQVKTKNEAGYVGEFRPLLLSLRKMNRNLSDTMKQIDESSEQVNLGSTQMAENAQSLAEGATDQAGAVEELNATIDTVADMSETSAIETKQAFEQVNKSAQMAEISHQEMEKLLEAMERINITSKEIGNIITQIEDIASQTNMLSLNASIEAARAGEAGKGFAVVANQIGKLAADSSQSAVNTRELISKTLKEIEIGNLIADNTSKSFKTVIEEMKNFAEIAKETSEKSNEQYISLQQIKEGIEQISAVVQSNSAAAEEASATSEELAAQSDNLKTLINKFKLIEKR